PEVHRRGRWWRSGEEIHAGQPCPALSAGGGPATRAFCSRVSGDGVREIRAAAGLGELPHYGGAGEIPGRPRRIRAAVGPRELLSWRSRGGRQRAPTSLRDSDAGDGPGEHRTWQIRAAAGPMSSHCGEVEGPRC
ncbi:unnamed protein product, partial [Urochloa humidicola]